MTEIENQNSEVQEAAPQVIDQNEQRETQTVQEPVTNQHLKQMRLKNDQLERELKQLRDSQMRLMEAQIANNAPQARPEPDELDGMRDDEFIPLGKVKKLTEKHSQKVLKNTEDFIQKEVAKALQKRDQDQFMDRLNRQYSDFSEVVNPETLSLLEEREPELAKSIAASQDAYSIGMQSYKYIKALKIAESAPQSRSEKELDKAIEKSEKSITSPMANNKRPIAQAFQLTDAMKKDLYREMHGYAALASSVPEMTQ
jgi:hypothetical protein